MWTSCVQIEAITFLYFFLADRTNGLAYAKALRPSVCRL